MPSFNFTAVTKPIKVNSNTKPASKYDIIIPDIQGVIWINLKGEYKVLLENIEYNIASEDYSCKDVVEIYEQNLVNDLTRVRHIRSERDRDDRDRSMYLPFTAGCSVKGNIVKHKTAGVTLFKIKKVFLDLDNIVAKQAIKYYRDNYIVIRMAIGSNFIDNYVAESNQEIHPDLMNNKDD